MAKQPKTVAKPPRTSKAVRGDGTPQKERVKFTDELKVAFLNLLAEQVSVVKTCEILNVSRSPVYDARDNDPEFALAWAKAVERGTDALEDEAIRRAMHGTDRPVYQGGMRVGLIREYSDNLMVVMLKARRPEKFKDRVSSEVSGPNGGPIKSTLLSIPADLSGLSEDELTKLYREAVDPAQGAGG